MSNPGQNRKWIPNHQIGRPPLSNLFNSGKKGGTQEGSVRGEREREGQRPPPPPPPLVSGGEPGLSQYLGPLHAMPLPLLTAASELGHRQTCGQPRRRQQLPKGSLGPGPPAFPAPPPPPRLRASSASAPALLRGPGGTGHEAREPLVRPSGPAGSEEKRALAKAPLWPTGLHNAGDGRPFCAGTVGQ